MTATLRTLAPEQLAAETMTTTCDRCEHELTTAE